MPVAHARLLRHVVLERRDELERGLRARQRDIQQAPLLLDLLGLAGGELVREIAVRHVDDVHRLPLLALGRMHRGEDEVVLVQQRRAREVARGRRRVERELREEGLPLFVGSRNHFQLGEIAHAHLGRVVQALQVRLVPLPYFLQLAGPGGFFVAQV